MATDGSQVTYRSSRKTVVPPNSGIARTDRSRIRILSHGKSFSLFLSYHTGFSRRYIEYIRWIYWTSHAINQLSRIIVSNNTQTRKIGSILLLVSIVLGFFLLYFAGLGKAPLLDPDEPVYGQVAKEMSGGAGWLTPHYNGKPWFDKPPLFYWLSSGSASLLGSNELADRLPSALLGVAVVLLVFMLTKYDFGRRAGIFSAIAMATCLQQIVLARAAVTDMTLVFCLTLALYAYRRWFDAIGGARFGWMILCGTATGLGMLAKGPVAPFLIFVTFCIHLGWARSFKRMASLDFLVGALTALLVGLPWFIAMYVIHKNDFVQGFLVANNVQRFLKPEHSKQTGHWYSYFMNIPILFVFFFPWSIFLVQAIRKCNKVNAGTKLAVAWFIAVFVFFSLSKTLLVTYIFPLYPAAALLVGVFLDRAASDKTTFSRGIRTSLSAGLVVALLISFILMKTAHVKYPEAYASAAVLSAILVTTFLAALLVSIVSKRESTKEIVCTIGIGMVLFASWLMWAVAPPVGARTSSRELAKHVNYKPSIEFIAFDMECPSALYYMNRLPKVIHDPVAVKNALEGKSPVFVITKASKAAKLHVSSSYICYKSGDLVMFTNQTKIGRKGFSK